MNVLIVDDLPENLETAVAEVTAYEPSAEVVITTSYKKAYKLIWDGEFDVVLSDLLMPCEDSTRNVGEEIPVGFTMVVYAAKRGVKLVGVCSNANHHKNEHAHFLDLWSADVEREEPLQIGGANLLTSARKSWGDVFGVLTGHEVSFSRKIGIL